ncbi:hypothetical protein DSO57_1028809 [Entomophthora muscae]|uniref:Uncharacterized protein n=1 Tax=Entomophthora muscae TaxID=34485 RepID=A0ACC2RG29_9FUNG|nr:hypothetical protein DSO57_1028809 [Entomophthora muscae]
MWIQFLVSWKLLWLLPLQRRGEEMFPQTASPSALMACYHEGSFSTPSTSSQGITDIRQQPSLLLIYWEYLDHSGALPDMPARGVYMLH